MATDAVPFAAPLSAAWSRALGVESLPGMTTTGSGGEVGGQAPERVRGQAKSLAHTQLSNEERLRIRATEMDLIRDAQAGSRAAFDALVRQYEHQVLRLALYLTGSEQDAEDIYQ